MRFPANLPIERVFVTESILESDILVVRLTDRSAILYDMNIASVVAQLKSERDRLDKAIAALSGLDGSGKIRTKRVLSADARERIAKAQRARWKKFKAAKKG